MAAPWTAEERARGMAVRSLKVTQETSHHLIRLRTAEPPHTHEFHDLTVYVLQGRAMVHLAGQTILVRPGDVIEIPRGVIHWAENLGPGDSLVYAIFNPPFDGKDRKLVDGK